MRKTRLGWILFSAFFLALIGGVNLEVYAQIPPGSKYFPETGHWVTGDFLLKYTSIPNPEEIYGDPITEAIIDAETGLWVQYFDNVRFELHPSESPLLRVRITPIGSLLYQKGQTLSLPSNTLGCRFYNNIDDGYQICFDFLTFFEQNGGVAQFGYPISNFEVHDGWIVQYFQRARLEWHPEYPSGEWVKVSNLGTKFFQANNVDRRHLAPNRSADIPYGKINDLKVLAFVSHPITSSVDDQTLNIIVRDQYHHPVENAQGRITVQYPDGYMRTLSIPNTDPNGLSTVTFQFNSKDLGTVEITVNVIFDNLEDQTKTSFQIWW